ncbi:MAG TPA: DUF2398 family protein [Longimicrobium sp.]
MTRHLDPAERTRACADVLDHVALTAERSPAAFRRAKRAVPGLREWFAYRTGWQLVSNHEMVRLEKHGDTGRVGRPFRRIHDAFDYEILIWLLWFAEGSRSQQFLLTHALEAIRTQANMMSGVGHIDWTNRAHRSAMQRAMETLEDLGVMGHTPDSQIGAWVDTAEGNVLYEFTPLVSFLSVSLHAEGPDAPVEPGNCPPPAEQRLFRALLMAPVLYQTEDPEAFALLRTEESRELYADEIRELLGWELRVEPHYALLMRPTEHSSGKVFSADSSIGHAALLLCAKVRDAVGSGDLEVDANDCVEATSLWVERTVDAIRSEWEANWSAREATRPLASLVEEVTSMMREWGMIDGPRHGGDYTFLPLAARYVGSYATNEEDATGSLP